MFTLSEHHVSYILRELIVFQQIKKDFQNTLHIEDRSKFTMH